MNKEQNEADCSFEINVTKLILNNPNIQFQIIKLYREKTLNQKNNAILNNEPIDVVISYANITDINLKRNGMKSCGKKDIENGELWYSIRSIFKNIPWVRKIFIIMPNEKINFLSDCEERKEKIIYVKDKDLVGFDTSNFMVITLNLH